MISYPLSNAIVAVRQWSYRRRTVRSRQGWRIPVRYPGVRVPVPVSAQYRLHFSFQAETSQARRRQYQTHFSQNFEKYSENSVGQRLAAASFKHVW